MPVGSNHLIDDHPTYASGRTEHQGRHTQVTAGVAAERGWYYRRAAYLSPEPDTRRCLYCGKQMFEALTLTADERAIRHPTSTNVLLEQPLDGWPQSTPYHSW